MSASKKLIILFLLGILTSCSEYKKPIDELKQTVEDHSISENKNVVHKDTVSMMSMSIHSSLMQVRFPNDATFVGYYNSIDSLLRRASQKKQLKNVSHVEIWLRGNTELLDDVRNVKEISEIINEEKKAKHPLINHIEIEENILKSDKVLRLIKLFEKYHLYKKRLIVEKCVLVGLDKDKLYCPFIRFSVASSIQK